MNTHAAADADLYEWAPQPRAAALVQELYGAFLARCQPAARLADRLRDQTGTRLIDWLDHFVVAPSVPLGRRLADLGFLAASLGDGSVRWDHPRGLFPTILLADRGVSGAAIKVESVADFLTAQRLEDATIHGSPLAPLRKALIHSGPGVEFWVLERHGDRGFDAVDLSAEQARLVLRHAEAFRRRKRRFADAAEGFRHASMLIRAAAGELGADRACDLFFAAEREYWQSRNRAARVQKARQDALGLGWGNHDHHTYRSSREHFSTLVSVLEELGMTCRERFYAGRQAGWGAQVIEQPGAGIVVFADVDLTPDEVAGDFAHEPLPPLDHLGTVGLWCRLHGEAMLEAGMHHLECQFDFDAARSQLQKLGVGSMKPFTDFPHLKQAFTEGEQWPVERSRVDSALAAGLVTAEQARQFIVSGALGSHMEVLQRDDGYKGFNQTGISEIITRTDPRHAQA
jgi:hypothetical protein